MVWFDCLGCFCFRFNNICVEGILSKEINVFKFICFIIKNVYEFIFDDFLFFFGIFNIRKKI